MAFGPRLRTSTGPLLALAAVLVPPVSAQPLPARQYAPGESDRYELRVQVEGAAGELYGVSEHRVVRRNGRPVEQVRWLRVSESVAGDLSEQARRIPPFELSLDPGIEPAPPPVPANPAAQMLIDSLHLIYVAASPDLGAARLQAPGDVVEPAEPYVEDGFERPGAQLERWAAGLTFTYVAADADKAVVRTDFFPPAAAPWPPFRDWMRADCGDRAGNFEIIAHDALDWVVAWGCERSTVTAHLARETGKIAHAELESRIEFRRRSCADEDLTDCGDITRGEKIVRATLVHKRADPPLPPDRLSLNPRDGLEYAKVPAGVFQMGCVPHDPECYERERPRHEVRISRAFWIGRTEVPVEAFERFVKAVGRAMPPPPRGLEGYNDGWSKKRHPMVKVTYEEALDYCAWAGGRLPTEAEWEYAARGGRDGLKYPWGNERSHEEANFWRSGGRDVWQHTAPVASFPANGFGLYDVAGNVYEWTADWFDDEYYARSPAVDPRGPLEGRLRAVRGGSGFINPAVMRISTRLQNAPEARRLGVGFRCVLDGDPQRRTAGVAKQP